MRRLVLLAALLPLTLAQSCPGRKFEVVMEQTPDGQARRELTVWTVDGQSVRQPAPDLLSQAEKAYGKAGEPLGQKLRFTGTFTRVLPPDLVHEGLTNHAFVASKTARVGDVLLYSERMPGQARPVELARNGIKLADTLVNALVAAAHQRPDLKEDPEKLGRLARFLRSEFRDDVLNVLLLGWQAATRMYALRDDPDDEEAPDSQAAFTTSEVLRLAHYLVERGYLRPAELSLASEVFPALVLRGVARKIAVILEYPADGPWPPTLAKLADIKNNSEEFERQFEQGLAAIGMTGEAFGELAESVIPDLLNLGSGTTTGTVTWRCKTRPFETNGKWNAEDGSVIWEANARQGCATPKMLFAMWADPNDEFQRAHFGRVVLTRTLLYEYVGWREDLTVAERTAWDAFVDALKPGPELATRLEAFRLPVPTTMPSSAPAEPADEAPRGAKLILSGLR